MPLIAQAPDEREQKILDAIRQNPELENCFLEMIDISHSSLGKLDNGDEAEEAVVGAIQKTGKVLLEEWSQKKSKQAAEETQNRAGNHLHGKKKSDGTPL